MAKAMNSSGVKLFTLPFSNSVKRCFISISKSDSFSSVIDFTMPSIVSFVWVLATEGNWVFAYQ